MEEQKNSPKGVTCTLRKFLMGQLIFIVISTYHTSLKYYWLEYVSELLWEICEI
jgi:hypothetical protein